MRLRSKLMLLTAAVVLIPVLCCGLPMAFSTWRNNARLDKFSDNLFNYPLPSGTEEEDRYTEMGLLGGNGNHCDYIAGKSLVTELSQGDIEAYYKDVEFPPAVSQSEYARLWGGLIPVRVHFADEPSADGRLCFSISISDIGNPPDFDIRCH